MAFGLFGSASETKHITETNVTDASSTAGQNSIAASSGSNISVNSVDPEITRQAFQFGGQALGSNVLVAGSALDTGLKAFQTSADLVPNVLKQQNQNVKDVLNAAQQQVSLAEQFASQGASLARGAQTGGASALLADLKPIVLGGAALLAAVLIFRRKAA